VRILESGAQVFYTHVSYPSRGSDEGKTKLGFSTVIDDGGLIKPGDLAPAPVRLLPFVVSRPAILTPPDHRLYGTAMNGRNSRTQIRR